MAKFYTKPQVVVKNRLPWNQGLRDKALHLHDCGWNEAQIAMSVGKTEKSVRLELGKLLYFRSKRPVEKPKDVRKPREKQSEPVSFQSPVTEAETMLRHRIRHSHGQRFLDNSPCNVQRLMVEYRLFQLGLEKPTTPLCRATEWMDV